MGVARPERAPKHTHAVGGAIVIVAIVIQTRGAPPPELAEEPAHPAPH